MIQEYFYGTVIQDQALVRIPRTESLSDLHEAYEVIRILNGVPLFPEAHFRRLEKTIELSGIRVQIDDAGFTSAIPKVIRANELQNGNIRLSVFFDDSGMIRTWIMGYTPHTYPTGEQFREGVPVISIEATREDPNAKIVNPLLRSQTEGLKKSLDVYETILVNEEGLVTEASRSNVFFVQGNTLITAPDDNVLEGVTRGVVISLAIESGIPVVFRCTGIEELGVMDACFLTGTSRDVLPVSDFDGHRFPPDNQLVRKLQLAFAKRVDEFLGL